MIPLIMASGSFLIPADVSGGNVIQFQSGTTGSLTREPAGLVALSSTLYFVSQRNASAGAPSEVLQLWATGDIVSGLAGKTLAFGATTYAFNDGSPTYDAPYTKCQWSIASYPLADATPISVRVY